MKLSTTVALAVLAVFAVTFFASRIQRWRNPVTPVVEDLVGGHGRDSEQAAAVAAPEDPAATRSTAPDRTPPELPSRPDAPDAEHGGWLSRRPNAWAVLTNEERIEQILSTQERYENIEVWNRDKVGCAHLLALYAVATHLDWRGRTADSAARPEAGELRFVSDGANYIFSRTEFPVYDELTALKSKARTQEIQLIEDPPENIDAPLAALVQSALDLLSK